MINMTIMTIMTTTTITTTLVVKLAIFGITSKTG